jgi:SAM-dependent methyltransferase
VNPRPSLASIDAAVRSGIHGAAANHLDVVGRRLPRRVVRYRKIFARLFDEVWQRSQPFSWLDVGAGYGEIVEAVSSLAPRGSRVIGVEPMKPKVEQARARGLAINEGYLGAEQEKVDFVSTVDVFSHIPHFDRFLEDVKTVLNPLGEIFVETGNLADLAHRSEFPGELGLPDHLVFAGERHLCGYLERAGFEILRVERQRIDGASHSLKNVVKKLIGRPVTVTVPYTSRYRQLLVRARLRAGQ